MHILQGMFFIIFLIQFFFPSRPRNEIDGNKLEKTLPTSLGKLTDLTELVVGKNTPFLFSIFTTCTRCFILSLMPYVLFVILA